MGTADAVFSSLIGQAWRIATVVIHTFPLFAQGGLFAMASAFPARFTQAMMAGQGVAGLVVALAGLLTTLAGTDSASCSPGTDESTPMAGSGNHRLLVVYKASPKPTCENYVADLGTLVYFGIAVAVLLACLLSFPILEQLPLSAHYTRVGGLITVNGGRVSPSICDLKAMGSMDDHLLEAESASPTSNGNVSMHRRLVGTSILSDLRQEDEDMSQATLTHETEATSAAASVPIVRGGLQPIYRYAFAVFFVFTITLSVFPGATSKIISSQRCTPGRARFYAADVFVLFSFVSFNAFDLIGRLAAGVAAMPKRWLPVASLSRMLFVPLFLACRAEDSRFQALLTADAFPLAIMPVFAFTNGYVGSLSMMAGSQEGAFAGTAMVLFLSLGLCAGSLLSFLVLFVSKESVTT